MIGVLGVGTFSFLIWGKLLSLNNTYCLEQAIETKFLLEMKAQRWSQGDAIQSLGFRLGVTNLCRDGGEFPSTWLLWELKYNVEFNRYRKVEEKHSGHNGSEQRQENTNESEHAG